MSTAPETGTPCAEHAGISLHALRARFDRAALAQLRDEVARLAAENERLLGKIEQLDRLYQDAEQWAESWRNDALDFQLQLCELTHSKPGLTRAGTLVNIPNAIETGDGDAYLCLAQ